MSQRSAAGSSESRVEIRIDKWLWAARFFKTRGLAVEAIDAGHVRRAATGGMEGERIKPAHAVKLDETYAIRRGDTQYVIVVTALSDRRGSATDAALLYRETDESKAAREAAAATRTAQHAAESWMTIRGRPTKQDRRSLAKFFSQNYRDQRDTE